MTFQPHWAVSFFFTLSNMHISQHPLTVTGPALHF
jgi:hypothetical protein